jgi:hypothetical protein
LYRRSLFKLIGKRFKALGAVVKWAVILGALAIIAVIIVAIVGIGKGVQEANKSAARVAPKFASISLWESEAQLFVRIGKPDSTQTQVVGGETDVYWYYGTPSTKGSYQFVFRNGRLTTKARY